MKKNSVILLLSIFLVMIIFCYQVTRLDSVSRQKADKVLKELDKENEYNKILYSISDSLYYVVIEINKSSFSELFINTNSSGKISLKREIINPDSNKSLFQRAFKASDYHSNYVTKIENPEVLQGNPSYFVFKDKKNTRHGEYSLPALAKPIPIDGDLYAYLFSALLKESSKK